MTTLTPTTWHPDPDHPYRGHIIHTRNPIPRAWAEGAYGYSSGDVADYTPAQHAASLAYHEAGHAVVMDMLGVEVLGITGHADSACVDISNDNPLHGLLVGLAAGHEADGLFLAEAGLYTPERAWAAERRASGDQLQAARLCQEHLEQPLTYGVSDQVGDWEAASRSARVILDLRWGAVARLAEELLLCWEEGEVVMPGRVVRQVIGA